MRKIRKEHMPILKKNVIELVNENMSPEAI
jgi:hypothetical protein